MLERLYMLPTPLTMSFLLTVPVFLRTAMLKHHSYARLVFTVLLHG